MFLRGSHKRLFMVNLDLSDIKEKTREWSENELFNRRSLSLV